MKKEYIIGLVALAALAYYYLNEKYKPAKMNNDLANGRGTVGPITTTKIN